MLNTSGLKNIPATVRMLQMLATARGNAGLVKRKEIRSGTTYRTWFVRPRGVTISNAKTPIVNTATMLVISPCLVRTYIDRTPAELSSLGGGWFKRMKGVGECDLSRGIAS
jgi:hypothetical protein